MNCVVCECEKARPGSLTCSDRHATTLRVWQWRHRRGKPIVEGGVALICKVCKQPLVADVDNGQVRYHVTCTETAKKSARNGSPYSRP